MPARLYQYKDRSRQELGVAKGSPRTASGSGNTLPLSKTMFCPVHRIQWQLRLVRNVGFYVLLGQLYSYVHAGQGIASMVTES
jgi:hypothetical protein